MKHCLFFLFLIIANANCVYSQIIAGNTSSGLIISNPAVNFSVSTVFGNGFGSFDLDCDSIADISVELYKGPTAIDGANYAYLHVLNPVFMVCADTINFQPRGINYFNFGDSIVCPAGTGWYNDTIIQLGNCGCMDCPGPCTATDLYWGYKNTSTLQVGWIKISINLMDGGGSSVPITLSVPEILSPCVTTSVSVPSSTSTPTYTGSGIATCGTFTYNYAINWPSCPGMCDASISITNVTGGTPNYSLLWTSSAPNQSGSTYYNACAGTHTCVISASGNTCTSTFLVQDPPVITFSLSSSNVSCYGGNDGSICCSASGGSGTYTYSWSPTGGNTSCITGLFAGNYALCVTDANGCLACSSVVVNEPTAIQVTESIIPASCTSCCDGNLQLQISGGTPAYSINYLPSTPSCTGTYSYNVTDSKGCTHMDSILISFATSVIEHEFETMFEVFPNPGNGNVEIRILNTEVSVAKIEIVDVYGKSVFTKTSELLGRSLQLNLNVAEGIYFLNIIESSGSKEFVKKIVILQ